MVSTQSGFPLSPPVDPATGLLTPVWQAFLLTIYNRTGAAGGASMTVLQAALTAEEAARAAADISLTAAISAENTARVTAVANEAATRAAADAALAARISASGSGGVSKAMVWFLT